MRIEKAATLYSRVLIKKNNVKRMKYLVLLPFFAGPAFPPAAAADTAPAYHLSPSMDAAALAGTGALWIGGYFAETRIEPFDSADIPLFDREDVNPFDRSATRRWSPEAGDASYYTLYACMGAPVFLMLDKKARKDYLALCVMYVQTIGLTHALSSLAKAAAERPRPFLYNPDAPLSDKLAADARKSFFSGHSSKAFASGVFLAAVFREYHPGSRWNRAVLGFSLSAAAATGCLRYSAGKHFPSDILTGAVAGGSIGFLVPYFHRRGSRWNKAALNISGDRAVSVIYSF